MAPRPLEPRELFLERLRASVDRGDGEIRFGASHYSHAVVRESSGWSVRRLSVELAVIEDYRAKNPGSFQPEHVEMLSTPGPIVAKRTPGAPVA